MSNPERAGGALQARDGRSRVAQHGSWRDSPLALFKDLGPSSDCVKGSCAGTPWCGPGSRERGEDRHRPPFLRCRPAPDSGRNDPRGRPSVMATVLDRHGLAVDADYLRLAPAVRRVPEVLVGHGDLPRRGEAEDLVVGFGSSLRVHAFSVKLGAQPPQNFSGPEPLASCDLGPVVYGGVRAPADLWCNGQTGGRVTET